MSKTLLQDRIDGLASMTPAQLRAEWRRTFRKEVPPHSPDLLARAMAWDWQAKQQGGLTPSISRQLETMAKKLEAGTPLDGNTAPNLSVGTRLVREWHGRTIKVLVTDAGFQFDGRDYRSLTQIVRHVTGTNWSGPRFFGLVKRSDKKGNADGQM